MVQAATPQTILVVDVERFSDYRRTDPQRVAVHDGLYDLLRQALREVDVEWDTCYHEDRGDGVLILAPAGITKARFLHYFSSRLADGLRLHNERHRPEEWRRLRMALHAGEVYFNGHGVVAGAINMAFRLLDAAPLRQALRDSSGVLAMIASSWFYDEVIRNSPEFRSGAHFPFLPLTLRKPIRPDGSARQETWERAMNPGASACVILMGESMAPVFRCAGAMR